MKRDDEIVNAAYNAGQEKYFSELVHRQKKVNSAYGIGFIEGAQWADANPHWISVAEELPPATDHGRWSDCVLICTHGGFIGSDSYDHKNKLWQNNKEDVTHWMEKPILPCKQIQSKNFLT